MTSANFSRRSLLFRSLAAGVGTYAISQNPLAASKTTPSTSLYAPPLGIAKLNANENPYGPSPSATRAMAEASTHSLGKGTKVTFTQIIYVGKSEISIYNSHVPRG